MKCREHKQNGLHRLSGRCNLSWTSSQGHHTVRRVHESAELNIASGLRQELRPQEVKPQPCTNIAWPAEASVPA